MLTPEMLEAARNQIPPVCADCKHYETNLIEAMLSGAYDTIIRVWVHPHLCYYFPVTTLDELRQHAHNLQDGELLLVKKGIHPEAAEEHNDMVMEIGLLTGKNIFDPIQQLYEIGHFDQYGAYEGEIVMNCLLPRDPDAPNDVLTEEGLKVLDASEYEKTIFFGFAEDGAEVFVSRDDLQTMEEEIAFEEEMSLFLQRSLN